MCELSELPILNKFPVNMAVYTDTTNINKIVATNGTLGIKADLLYQDGLYDILAADIVNDSLNRLACHGGEVLTFCYNIMCKDVNDNSITQVTELIESGLDRYNCEQILKNVENTGYNINKFDIHSISIGKSIKKDTEIDSEDIIIGLTTDKMNLGMYERLLNANKDGIISTEEFRKCLEPAESYYREILGLYKKDKIKSCVYIETRNIREQINNILPNGLKCDINLRHIPHQDIIDRLSDSDGINYYEEYGAGMCCCLITDKASNEIFFEDCQKFNPFVLGTIG